MTAHCVGEVGLNRTPIADRVGQRRYRRATFSAAPSGRAGSRGSGIDSRGSPACVSWSSSGARWMPTPSARTTSVPSVPYTRISVLLRPCVPPWKWIETRPPSTRALHNELVGGGRIEQFAGLCDGRVRRSACNARRDVVRLTDNGEEGIDRVRGRNRQKVHAVAPVDTPGDRLQKRMWLWLLGINLTTTRRWRSWRTRASISPPGSACGA